MTDDSTPSDASPPPPGASANAAAGWYPTTPGVQAYWNGDEWTGEGASVDAATVQPTTSSSDDQTMGMLAHLLGIFTGFLGPLIIFLIKKDDSPYIRHHAAQSLNFQLTLMIAYFVSALLILVLIGLLLFPILFIGALVLQIMASVAANRGEMYRYPMTIQFVT